MILYVQAEAIPYGERWFARVTLYQDGKEVHTWNESKADGFKSQAMAMVLANSVRNQVIDEMTPEAKASLIVDIPQSKGTT